MSKSTRILYKYLLIDFKETDFSIYKRKHKRVNPYAAVESMQQEMTDQRNDKNESHEDVPYDKYNPEDQQQEHVWNQIEPATDNQGSIVYKRRKIDFGFHLVCAGVGILFTMGFSNWTSIYGFVFTASDIVDYSTVWIRLGGNMTGLVIVLVISIINACQKYTRN